MTPRACRLVAVALAWCAVSVTPAHAVDRFVVIEGADSAVDARTGRAHPPLARMDAPQVVRIAEADRGMRLARQMRPGSTLRARFLPTSRTWRVSVRDPNAGRSLARIDIADATGRVVKRWALPIGRYPTRSSEQEVVARVRSNAKVRRFAHRWGDVTELVARARFKDGAWEVDLHTVDATSGRLSRDPVIRVDVADASQRVNGVWTGVQVAWRMARGDRYAFGGSINAPEVWIALFVLFALVMIDWARLRSWWTLDVMALLALEVSYECFQRGLISWSVPLAVMPLIWLGVHMAWCWLRGVPAPGPASVPRGRWARLALRRVPTVAIFVLCVAVAGVRIGVVLDGGNVIDVGYAGVAGARAELRGDAPWGHMPTDNPHGDTYGPVNYLAYVPATALLDDPDTDRWGTTMPAAQATAIAADLGAVLVLALIGWRWISRRGAALLAAGWLTCPWTALVVASSANDTLPALALLGAFAAMPRAWLRGALVGVAAMVKFAPLVVLASMLHVGMRARTRQAVVAAGCCALVIAAGLAWVTWRLDQGVAADLHTFWQRTVGFQEVRGSPFSPWGLYGWQAAQQVAQVLVIVGIAAMAAVPRARDAWQVAAGSAAALIGVQLVVTHWFYLYTAWFVGFVLIVLVAARERTPVCLRA